MIFCAISIKNTQGPIGPGQWKLGLKASEPEGELSWAISAA